jgi:hypothetical protein
MPKGRGSKGSSQVAAADSRNDLPDLLNVQAFPEQPWTINKDGHLWIAHNLQTPYSTSSVGAFTGVGPVKPIPAAEVCSCGLCGLVWGDIPR